MGSDPFLEILEACLEEFPGITRPEFRKVVNGFKNTWISEIDNSVNMGQVGFSAGLNHGNERIPIIYVYDNRISLISEKVKQSYNLPDNIYNDYKTELQKSPVIYDKYLIANKVQVPFDSIDVEVLKIIIDATINFAKRMKNSE